MRVLIKSGVIDGESYGPSGLVLEHLGEDRIATLKKRHGDAWGVAAAYEYCVLKLTHGSAPFIASECMCSLMISGSKFDAGYLLRDLEFITDGWETTAVSSRARLNTAGDGGGQDSSSKKKKRKVSLVDAIEAELAEKPFLAGGDEAAVYKLATAALSRAVQKSPELWRRGQGSVVAYIDEIRFGREDADLKARLDRALK